MTDVDDYLAHFGVKGMKWGRSKAKAGIDKQVTKAKKEVKEAIKRPVSADAKGTNSSKKVAKKHGTDALSDKDLKALVNRMNMEQQYAALSQKTSPGKGGRAYVADILKDVGKNLLTDLVTSGVKRGASAAAGGFTNSWEYPQKKPLAIGR